MPKTISEEVFEEYCAGRGIPCNRIPETSTKTPDYELVLGTQRVIVEVKEIARNPEERESDRLLAERGRGNVTGGTPGDRVRSKIAACSKQIKARTNGILPSMLVVFNDGRVLGHVEPYHIRVAMYGLEQVYLSVPPIGSNASPSVTGMGYGPRRKMTPEDNTSISAVAALVMSSRHEIHLLVYHNRFAAVPLDPALLGAYGVRQFVLDQERSGVAADWREVAIVAK
jgi:hypothetical protein